MNTNTIRSGLLAAAVLLFSGVLAVRADDLRKEFASPPDSARPWVYWMFMDGNLTREGMTADLEAMKAAGIGGVIMMETNIGIPRGTVDFMSKPWQELFAHAVHEAERLGLQITLNSGPGWTGSGGPWVTPEQSMQHLVATSVQAKGGQRFDAVLPRAQPRPPYFGSHLPPELEKARKEFYRDVAVLAFPTPKAPQTTADIDEKALYIREPYSSKGGVKPHLPSPPSATPARPGGCIPLAGVIDLSAKLDPTGRLTWDAPPGEWTIMRLGRTSTGANTRPAPLPGLGLECDKMDASALDAHFETYIGALLKTVGPRRTDGLAGWTNLHIDSWEMGAQNWTAAFRDEFTKRRGYDPLPYLPAYTGLVVGSPQITERFLWDVRRTCQELVVQNHATHLKDLGRRHGLGLSIEPYDMNPCADMALGSVADTPMCEFWANTFETSYSCLEAVSIAHTRGRPVVAAEAFTSDHDGWHRWPGAIKQQADWALCMGINRFVFHRYQHQPYLDRRPGMTFGPYGVHWERTQTWWPMAGAFHAYLARCQDLLRRGTPVADVLYLTPEDAPMVFTPPTSARAGADRLRDKRGHSFDACDADTLLELATVKDGLIVFPGGAQYRLLVLPDWPTMTPRLLRKVVDLVQAGAAIVGRPPSQSPSLSGYPQCDRDVAALAAKLWGEPSASTAGARSGPVRASGTRPFQAAASGSPTAPPDGGTTNAPASRQLGQGRVYATSSPASALPPQDHLAGARWIWHGEGNAMAAPAGEVRHFRRTITLDKPPASACVAVTADNSFTLRVNGKAVGQGDNFTEVSVFNVTGLLKSGANTIQVEAVNSGDAPNPAGLIAHVTGRLQDGSAFDVVTDKTWESAKTPAGPWSAARDLGPMPMAPWNLRSRPAGPAELYPDYAVTAQILAGMNVPPDFESTPRLRFIHRRDGQREIYFVSNCADTPVVSAAAFRTTGQHATIWDPMTGRVWRAPAAREENGRTMMDLPLDQAGSVFVIFEPAPPAADLPPWPAPQATKVLASLDGPWEVSFEPGLGAPARATLPALIDLAASPEPAIRYFSGIATYRKRFADPRAEKPSQSPIFLDLGRVEVMARVKLNGKDLGVLWKAPYRVEVSGVLHAGENELDIQVANLWINRLIGDAGIPADQRVTWTTWSPYKKDSPLVPSGLIGPVKIVTP